MNSVIVIAGATASGKSDLALSLAKHLPIEIVSCDSVQVYQGFDIGSAKPTAEALAKVPHHLIDCVTFHDSFDAGIYANKARTAIRGIIGRGKIPVVVGGSGLYLRALMAQEWHDTLPKDEDLRANLSQLSTSIVLQQLTVLDPERAAAIHPNDRFRLMRALEINLLSGQPVQLSYAPLSDAQEFRFRVVLLNPERSLLRHRIQQRVDDMLNLGLVDEVSTLLAQGCPPTAKPMQSIGYKETLTYLNQSPRPLTSQLKEAITIATHQYAKRQCTWNRKLEPELIVGPPNPLGQVLSWWMLATDSSAKNSGAVGYTQEGAP